MKRIYVAIVAEQDLAGCIQPIDFVPVLSITVDTSSILVGKSSLKYESNIDQQNKVIGFFDVSSLATQRLYFNNEDFYAVDLLQPYFGTVTCDWFLASILGDSSRGGPPDPFGGPCPQPSTLRIQLSLVEHVSSNDTGICEGPYIATPTICGDCNIVGSNIVPEF